MNWTISYAYSRPETCSIESALLRVWQRDFAGWQAVRRRVVDDDLGSNPETRLALLLGEEMARHQPPTPERDALDRYLFQLGCRAIEAGTFSVVEGIAPLIGHFLSRDATDATVDYGSELIERLLPQIRLALIAPSVHLSVANGLTGVLMSLGMALDRAPASQRIEKAGSEIRALIGQYVHRLQSWQLPVDASQGQYTMFPNWVSQQDGIWEAPEQSCWAFGDVGQALFLMRASRWLQQPAWAAWAVRIAMYTVFRRQIGKLTIDQAGIRWGRAGMMMLYQQLYTLTGESALEQEATYWRTQLATIIPTLEATPVPDHSLLDGLLGIYGAYGQLIRAIQPYSAYYSAKYNCIN